jgi:3-oxoacyl-[acyl-carrier protein] reductase
MGMLKGRCALVTGASRRVGIGAAIARAFADEGANVFLGYWTAYDREMPWGSDSREIDELIRYIGSLGLRVGAMEADLSEPGTPTRLFDAACAELGHIDILVNNAAMNVEQDLDGLDADALDRVYRVNARGTMLMTAEFNRRHDGRPGGRVINMSSGQGRTPMPAELPYVASKGAVEAFTRSASVTLARKDITINAIDPGATDTGWMSAELADKLQHISARGRVGTPDDAARLAVFLASDRASWISGQVLSSTGGA